MSARALRRAIRAADTLNEYVGRGLAWLTLGAVAVTFAVVVMRYGFAIPIDGSILIFGALIGLGIIVKHRGNIRRLLNGTENKVSSFKPAVGWLNKEEKPQSGN